MASLLLSLRNTLHFSQLQCDSNCFPSLSQPSKCQSPAALSASAGALVCGPPCPSMVPLFTLWHIWKLLVGFFCRILFSLLGCKILMTGVGWYIPLRHKLSLNKSDSVFFPPAQKSCVPAQHTEHRNWPSTVYFREPGLFLDPLMQSYTEWIIIYRK